MGTIATLVNGITTRTQAVLGQTYSQLNNVVDLESNAFKGSTKRFGVLALNLAQADDRGTTSTVTIRQNFQVVVTDGYAPTGHAGDSTMRATQVGLMESAQAVFNDLIKTKAGVPASTMLVAEMAMEQGVIRDHNVVFVKMTFNITYRHQL